MHVSPSQLETYDESREGCRRKWAYSRCRPRKSNRYAEFGDRAHKVAEDWLRDGKAPDATTPEGRTILAGLEYLPMPGLAMVEHTMNFNYGGVHYTGRVDFLYGHDPGRIIVVGDHKTTGDLCWAKTEQQLLDDTQRTVYAFWLSQALGVQWVAASWIYYIRATGKNKPQARPVVVVEDRDSIAQRFAAIHSKSLQIVADHGRPPESFPRHIPACGAFGGCPYKEECWSTMTPAQRAAAELGFAV